MVDKPFGHSIFCDDIRHEIGGKRSFIGAYNGSILADNFPIAMPKFCISSRYYEDVEDSFEGELVYNIWAVDEGELLYEEKFDMLPRKQLAREAQRLGFLDADISIEKGRRPIVWYDFELTFAPFVAAKPGNMRVRVVRGDEVVRLGSLRLDLVSAMEAEHAAVVKGMRKPSR